MGALQSSLNESKKPVEMSRPSASARFAASFALMNDIVSGHRSDNDAKKLLDAVTSKAIRS